MVPDVPPDAAEAGPVPSHAARVAGILYLIVLAAGISAEVVVRGSLVVPGDVAATAMNLTTHAGLYRAGMAADLIMIACDITLTMILYSLLAPSARVLSLVATGLRLVPDAMLGVKTLLAAAPLFILRDARLLTGFDEAQRQALVFLMLRLHDLLYGAAMIFFGLNLLALGWILGRQSGWGRWVGILLAIGGVGDLIGEAPSLLMPQVAEYVPDGVGLSAVIGELALTIWLLAGAPGVAPSRLAKKARRASPTSD